MAWARGSHRFQVRFQSGAGEHVATLALAPDWGPTVEWAHLECARRGQVPAVRQPLPARIEPVWHRQRGAPNVEALRLLFPGNPPPTVIIPLSFLRDAVQTLSGSLVAAGKLSAGEQFSYQVRAYSAPPVADTRHENDLQLRSEEEPLSITRVSRESLDAIAERRGVRHWDRQDLPVYLHQRVLDQARGWTRASADREAGGMLIGHLHRVTGSDDFLLEITGQLPAHHAVAEADSLAFTAQTWVEVSAALRLRGDGARAVGWYHSHPRVLWPCRQCPPERSRRCPAAASFFSGDDCRVHRALFPAAYAVALLLSYQGDPAPRFDLFGWRHGVITARGYHLVPSPPAKTSVTDAGALSGTSIASHDHRSAP
jgi:proteasome lid subunit RPN8/RPN11